MPRPASTREWFREWFGEEYLALYPHRDEAEARDAVRLYLSVFPGTSGSRVLDLACGAGRHLRALGASGVDAVGLDLSITLLRSARSSGAADPLVRGDMRHLPFRERSFGGLTSFFTSFGYFDDPADDRQVLREVARVLSSGGTFMLDFLNASRVRDELVEEDSRDIGEARIIQHRKIVHNVVVKRISIEPRAGGSPRHFEERVRLYSAHDLVSALADAGLVATHRFGDYRGTPFDSRSPRLILAGRSAPPEDAAEGDQ